MDETLLPWWKTYWIVKKESWIKSLKVIGSLFVYINTYIFFVYNWTVTNKQIDRQMSRYKKKYVHK